MVTEIDHLNVKGHKFMYKFSVQYIAEIGYKQYTINYRHLKLGCLYTIREN
jgi:hypothetical protein